MQGHTANAVLGHCMVVVAVVGQGVTEEQLGWLVGWLVGGLVGRLVSTHSPDRGSYPLVYLNTHSTSTINISTLSVANPIFSLSCFAMKIKS